MTRSLVAVIAALVLSALLLRWIAPAGLFHYRFASNHALPVRAAPEDDLARDATASCTHWLNCRDPTLPVGLPQPRERYAAWRAAAVPPENVPWKKLVRKRDAAAGTSKKHNALVVFPGVLERFTMHQAMERFPEKVRRISHFDNVFSKGDRIVFGAFALRDVLVLPSGTVLLATDDGAYLREMAETLRSSRDSFKTRIDSSFLPLVVLEETVPHVMGPRDPTAGAWTDSAKTRVALLPPAVCLVPEVGPFWPEKFQHFLQDHTDRFAVGLDALWTATASGGLLENECELNKARFLFRDGSSRALTGLLAGGTWAPEVGTTDVAATRVVYQQEKITHLVPDTAGSVVFTTRTPYRAARTTGIAKAVRPLLHEALGGSDAAEPIAGRTLLVHARARHEERNFVNYLDLVPLLQAKADALGLQLDIVFDRHLNAADRASERISRARVLLFMHGGAVFNVVYASPDAVVIELVFGETSAQSFVEALGLEYHRVDTGAERTERNVRVDPALLEPTLAALAL